MAFPITSWVICSLGIGLAFQQSLAKDTKRAKVQAKLLPQQAGLVDSPSLPFDPSRDQTGKEGARAVKQIDFQTAGLRGGTYPAVW
ncbi:MAG: hypothetical protein ACREH8_24620, partial [Opitutaceae bacterium]